MAPYHGTTTCHHHCSNHVSPAVYAVIAASASSNNEKTSTTSCSLWCGCCGYLRYLVAFLGLLACAIDFILRFNISVAIVAMVNSTVTKDVNSSYACPAALNASSDAQSTTGGGEYNWSTMEQGVVLGTFFWGFMVTKTIGGRISEMLGPTFTVSVSVTACAALTLLTPTVADIHPLALAALRCVMGMLEGPIFPALFSIISRWALPDETTTMISIIQAGTVLGTLVSLGLSGTVIKHLGWRWVFWGAGILGLAWVPFWVIFVRDSPRQHPGTSSKELQLLAKNHNNPRKRVPWSRVFGSRHIYLLIMMEFVVSWSQAILTMEGPTFLTSQIGMNLQTAGYVNIIVTGASQLFTLFYGWSLDMIERRGYMERIKILRVAQVFGTILVVGSMVWLSMAGCDGNLVLVLFITMVSGIIMCALNYFTSAMILAPNYAGTVAGILGVGSIGSFFSPLFASYFMEKKDGWLIVYLVSAAIHGVVCLIYNIDMPVTVAEWNMYEEIPGEDTRNRTRKTIRDGGAGD